MKRITKVFLSCAFLIISFVSANNGWNINAAVAGDGSESGRQRAYMDSKMCDNVLNTGDWAMFGYNTFGTYYEGGGYRTAFHTFTIRGRTSYGLYNPVIGPYLPYGELTEKGNEFTVGGIYQIKGNNAANNTVLIAIWNSGSKKYEDKWVKADYMIETTGKKPYTCVSTKQ